LLAVAIAACSRPAPRLSLPEAASVWRIEVIRWDPQGQRQTTTTSTDARHVEQLLAYLEEHNSQYRTDWPRREWPAQEYTISFEAQDSVPLILWVGRNWLGGVDEKLESDRGQRLARRRPLGQAERERLIALLPAESP
jgi:hypothetical protein